MKTITQAAWREAKRHGFTSVAENGQRYMLTLDKATGATVLQPVSVSGSDDKTPIEKLADLVSSAIVELLNSNWPDQIDQIVQAVEEFKRTKEYASLMNGGCNEFATLFRAIEEAALCE